MGQLVQTIDLAYNSGQAIKSFALKSHFLSVRLIRDGSGAFPEVDSYISNILLNGKCIDAENRKLYLFYIDTYYYAAWIIEVDIDTRVQNVVYYNALNTIGFHPDYKIHNARIVSGKIIWTDNRNPIYQIDIERAKTSYIHGIGYGQNTDITEWVDDVYYYEGQIVSEGKYMYKCVVANIALNPIAWAAYWDQVCLLEDCYYSMKVENLYFAPMPPQLAPIVEYLTDDTRKINNLRQTLFQFAYNYVYMDWRESTYSPASIVPMPNGEEAIATGLATEVIALNNCLKIKVNTGTEEVRKIKIIGRSSQDPSSWFLVDEIDKFSLFEVQYEASTNIQTELNNITITIPLPIIMSSGMSLPSFMGLALSTPAATPTNMYLSATEDEFEWGYNEYE